uniref:Transmembrane protein n=1 Tax=Caenorhabditis tropicalis TaxID=1561998 RepID=A0A1I7V0Y8_9PELO
MDKKTKKLERKKKTIGGGAESVQDKSAKKKLEREEERLKATNRDMSMFKMKSMFAIGLAFTALLSTFNSERRICEIPEMKEDHLLVAITNQTIILVYFRFQTSLFSFFLL